MIVVAVNRASSVDENDSSVALTYVIAASDGVIVIVYAPHMLGLAPAFSLVLIVSVGT